MNEFERNRRSIVAGLGVLAMTPLVPQDAFATPGERQAAYVLGRDGGEHLIHFRDGGNIYIKASSRTGSNRLALGTQEITRGAGVPVHRHPQMDEVFYVVEGSGTVTIDDVPHPFEQGGTLFIPTNTWHGFANPEQRVVLLWIVAPQGLEEFFRETCSPPGEPKKQLTREQIKAIALKYGTEFR